MASRISSHKELVAASLPPFFLLCFNFCIPMYNNLLITQQNCFKKRKIKEQMKIILEKYFEIFQISSSGKIYNKNIMKLQEFEIPLGV